MALTKAQRKIIADIKQLASTAGQDFWDIESNEEAARTDAKGGDDFNQKLSERRAEAVRDYMVAQFRIAPDRLSSRGFGGSQLLDPARPEDGVNRRVQIVNTSVGAGARH